MNKTIVVIVIVAVIILGGYFLLKSLGTSTPSSNLSPQPIQTPPSATAPTPVTQETPSTEQNIVTYTDAGYLPSALSIKVGAAVTFKNESSKSMWTASAVHPSHAIYSGISLGAHCPDATNTAFDACGSIQPDNSWSFTFTKNGVWKYHNHLNPGDTGTILVE